jgi:hypothetical protein
LIRENVAPPALYDAFCEETTVQWFIDDPS